MDPALTIDVQQLGKCYALGSAPCDTLIDHVRTWRPWQRAPRPSDLWALNDVSFSVTQGEVLGIIGHNGAGKSTLLKILSNITAPTTGEARIRGRLSSLLEVGTGFHPELTGRENVYLNGTILGMRRAEITRQFDAIVAFADIDRFIDMPIKRYSSGMQVRLAFAVAAHVAPDILIIDEVLAVGDFNFQRKCMQHMAEAGQRGCTVLVVSHSLAVISQMCPRALLLAHGRLMGDGSTAEIINQYLSEMGNTTLGEYIHAHNSLADEEHPAMALVRVAIVDQHNQPQGEVRYDAPVRVVIEYIVRQPLHGCRIWFQIISSNGMRVLESTDHDIDATMLATRVPGHYRALFQVPGNWLNPGHYHIHLSMLRNPPRTVYARTDTVRFVVTPLGAPWLAARPEANRHDQAAVRPAIPWHTERIA